MEDVEFTELGDDIYTQADNVGGHKRDIHASGGGGGGGGQSNKGGK